VTCPYLHDGQCTKAHVMCPNADMECQYVIDFEKEVERLKAHCDNIASMAAAAADEMERYRAAAEMATIACASVWPEDFKRAFGVDRLRLLKTFADALPGITEETRIEDYLCALLFEDEKKISKAQPTAAQEREAIVNYIINTQRLRPMDDARSICHRLATKIMIGEHWPTEVEP
jgi:hypothetical protein